MEHYRFSLGEYTYFNYPLSDIIQRYIKKLLGMSLKEYRR